MKSACFVMCVPNDTRAYVILTLDLLYALVLFLFTSGSSTASVLEMATKRSLFDKRDEGSRRRLRLEYRNGTMLGRTHATSGCAAVAEARY